MTSPLVIAAFGASLAVIALILVIVRMHKLPGQSQSPPVNFESRPKAKAPNDSQLLKILTWNTAWAYGMGSEGQGAPKPHTHFTETLDRMADILRCENIDIACLQEVDFGSRRSHHVDQSKVLAQKADLPHVAQALSWKSPWVPYPYWPPSHHFGTMRSGGAILSRFPMDAHRVQLLPKPSDYSALYNLFYLHRYLQTADITTPWGNIEVWNIHLEAFSEANRTHQAQILAAQLERNRSSNACPQIVAGDFNTETPKEPTLDIILGNHTLVNASPSPNENRMWTFPADAPNRQLDHTIVSPLLEVVDCRVLSVGALSDHLPLCTTVRLRSG